MKVRVGRRILRLHELHGRRETVVQHVSCACGSPPCTEVDLLLAPDSTCTVWYCGKTVPKRPWVQVIARDLREQPRHMYRDLRALPHREREVHVGRPG